MSFNWIKKGLIFDPSNKFDWMMNYAQVPTVLELEDRLRIYFTTRPLPDKEKNFISNISFLDVDKSDPLKILYVHNKPILQLGGPGTFDEFGIHPTSVLNYNGLIYLYFQGWTRGLTVPYSTSLGLAISEDNGKTFKKYSVGPLFGRTPNEPFLENGFFVYREFDKWHMWYSSCSKWVETSNKYEPIYNIVYASSKDGISWERTGQKCLADKFENEVNNRPSVVKIENKYHMWFCYRSINDFRGGNGSYRIGYSVSDDLKNWTRCDSEAGISISKEGWDSQMIAYPYVIKIDKKFLMFYNGNEFGKYGFGAAELEGDFA